MCRESKEGHQTRTARYRYLAETRIRIYKFGVEIVEIIKMSDLREEISKQQVRKAREERALKR